MRSKESPCLVSSALRIERSLRYPSRSPLRFGIRLDDLLEKVEQLLRVFLCARFTCEDPPILLHCFGEGHVGMRSPSERRKNRHRPGAAEHAAGRLSRSMTHSTRSHCL